RVKCQISVARTRNKSGREGSAGQERSVVGQHASCGDIEGDILVDAVSVIRGNRQLEVAEVLAGDNLPRSNADRVSASEQAEVIHENTRENVRVYAFHDTDADSVCAGRGEDVRERPVAGLKAPASRCVDAFEAG